MFEVGELREAVAALAVSASVAPQGVSSSEWVALVGETQRLVNQLSAVQTTALARLAALEEVVGEDGTTTERDRGVGHQRLDAPALVSDLLGLTDAGACARVEHAVRVASKIPELIGAMSQGRLDTYRAAVVSEELADADAEVCAAVMARVKTHLGNEPAAVLRRRVRRVLAQVAPDLVRVKAARARTDRALRRWTHRAGADEWSGTFPVEQARPAWAVIDKLAKKLVADGTSTNLDQARADALMQLIHGQASGTYLVQVAISADDLAAHATPEGPDDELVDVTGLGIPGITHVSRAWLHSLPGAPFTTHTGTSEPTQPSLPEPKPEATEPKHEPEPGSEPEATEPVSAEHRPARAASRVGSPTGTAFTKPATPANAPATGAVPCTHGGPVRVVTQLAVCDPTTGALLGLLDRTDRSQDDRTDRSRDTYPDQPDAATGGNRASRRRHRRAQRVRPPRARGGGDIHPGYTPPAWMATHVKARDGSCRFPGCTTNVRFCDLDHVTPWPTGPTATGNLIALCRRHHRIKQTPGWSVRLDIHATTTWTDPTGRTRTTTPQQLLTPEATGTTEPLPPIAVDPHLVPADHPVARGIQASDSVFEEDLDLAIMLAHHQDAQTARTAARAAPRGNSATDDSQLGTLRDGQAPLPACRTRPRPDLTHPRALRTFTLDWPAPHQVPAGRTRPNSDDPPPF